MNQKLKILIVEDSISFSVELDSLLFKIGYSVEKIVDNAEEALLFIEKQIPDLIFLDIDLKGEMTGIDLSEKIAYLNIPIIFITSYADDFYYDKAKKSKLLAYLVKPLSSFSLKAVLETTINNAFNQLDEKQENEPSFSKKYLFVNKKGVFYKIPICNISYIKSNDNYCEVYTETEDFFLVRSTISNFTDKILPKNDFIRIHRQYIIHINYINTINFNTNIINIRSIPSVNLPIGRFYKKELKLLTERQF